MDRKAYDTDLSDIGWELLAPLIPPEKEGGRHRSVAMPEVVNAIFYVLRSGCAWRLLPHDFPAWQTVYGYFNRWRQDGLWEQLNAALRGLCANRKHAPPHPRLRSWIVSRSRRAPWPAHAATMAPSW